MINKMFTLLKYFWRTSGGVKYYTGALLDTRKPEEKKNDIYLKDIVASANAPVWYEKKLTEARAFPPLNQNQSFTCGANALAKSIGILFYTNGNRYLPFSREDIYSRRFNRPSQGMSLIDMFNIGTQGVTLDVLLKSKGLTDADYDGVTVEQWMRDVGKVFSITHGVFLPSDIDTIASVIQTTGKGVILLMYFNAGEYSKVMPYVVDPMLTASSPSALRHFVVAVDAILVDGIKCLVIEDSAWFGGINRRLLTNDWVKSRVIWAAYPMRFKFDEKQGDKPHYDGTIVSAQKCLQYEGYFPLNVDFIESVGPVTRTALIGFQQRHNPARVTGLLDDATKSLLQQLYP